MRANTNRLDYENLAEVITNQISAMIAYWDKDLICRYANDAYLFWFGKSKEEMINKMHIKQLLGDELFEKKIIRTSPPH